MAVDLDGLGDVLWPRSNQVLALNDPVELAHWLLEVCAPTPATAAVGVGDGGLEAHPRSCAEGANGDDDDDDEGEDVDEESADDDERTIVGGDGAGAEADRATTTDTTTVEDDLETIAAALSLAKGAVEQLQLKMLLKAGKQMQEQALLDQQTSQSRRPDARTPSSTPRAGVPTVNARTIATSSCAKCQRYFSAFQRGRNCQSCGHTFCQKCSAQQQLLPSCFGFGSQAVRVCDPCSLWLQVASDRYFDAVDLVGRTTDSLPRLRKATPNRGSKAAATPLSPLSLQRKRRMEYRRQRHSIATTDRPRQSSKPWFSGNLRALHVGDRHLRRKSTSECSAARDAENRVEVDVGRSTQEPPRSDPNGFEELQQATDGQVDAFRPSALSIGAPLLKHSGGAESSEGEEANEDDESNFHFSRRTESQDSTSVQAMTVSSIPDQGRPRAASKPSQLGRTKRTKFVRSASFDFTNLHSAIESPASPAASLVSSDAGESVRSGTSTRSDRTNAKKFFDDSDIVDRRRSVQGKDADTEYANALDLQAAVLRFAVDDVGSKESQSLKRSLVRFGRKNIVLDRYSLELDCTRGIVRVKSVFMHRFWSFRCDSVQRISFHKSGSGGSIARVMVSKLGGHGHHFLEWQFGDDEERLEFKQAVERFKSRELKPIGEIPRQEDNRPLAGEVSRMAEGYVNTIASAPGGDLVQYSPSNASAHEAHAGDFLIPANDADSTDLPVSESKLQLLPGEKRGTPIDVPATLLIGPAGDVFETSAIWGRLRGTISLTNYRVLFMPLEKGHVPYRTSTFGAVAYIPLFAVISSHVMYPGGRRPRSARPYQSTAHPILVISCKDARSMRLEVEGPPNVADERSHSLQVQINKLADASQRYRMIDLDRSPPLIALNEHPMDLQTIGEGVVSTMSRGDLPPPLTITSVSSLTSPRSIMDSASPVLHSGSLAAAPGSLERSDAFAFYYSVDLIPTELNGWHLYTDEREFKRQVAADPAAQPFLKFYQNGRGNMCKSYPAKLLVPASMNSSTLLKVAEFRAKNRLPAITYYHQRNRCVLVRSGQPLLGNLLSGSSSLSDQLLVGAYRRLPEIIKTQSHAAPSSRPIYIFDARKLKASTGNRLMGKGGVETPQDYPGAIVYHLNIANMYRMQSSFLALVKLVLPGGVDDQEKGWLSSLETTRWLNHVRLVLEGAVKIARVLELEGSSVLVHCSDGWDRTAQLTALAQLMIDPFYRTIRGFAVLVEKDWCAFGYKFAERLGGDRGKDPHRSKSSPVMFQFLDAVWQMQRQFPNAFEFNERFLLHIANSLTSGMYGTFLYDSRAQREANGVQHRTVSVWTPVLLAASTYLNANYTLLDKPIWPWTSSQMMKLWEAYFFQWHPKYHDCRWIASLVHHGGKVEEQKLTGNTVAPLRRSSTLQTATSFEESKDSEHGSIDIAAQLNGSTPTSTSGGRGSIFHRDRQSSGDLPSSPSAATGGSGTPQRTGNSTLRGQRQQTKAPPMHKIFLFKS